MPEVLLEASELHSYYGASHVLRGVDFAVNEGESVGLMGRNGMGKTTLIRSMLGIVVPRSGTVRVRGYDTKGWPTYRIARHGIAYVPEGRGIFPNLSVLENLQMAARPARDGRATGPSSACSKRSRASPSACATAARNSPAASSRCSRSAARCAPTRRC
jgi:branched-chain amino acid transport system ATP-binding protein